MDVWLDGRTGGWTYGQNHDGITYRRSNAQTVSKDKRLKELREGISEVTIADLGWWAQAFVVNGLMEA